MQISRHLISRYQVGSPIKMKTRNIPTEEEFGKIHTSDLDLVYSVSICR